MIFISLGTILIPFDRLINTSIEVLQDFNQEIFIQSGITHVPNILQTLNSKPFISNKEMIQKIKTAEIIICAAGEGTIFQILEYARYKPILFPRLKQFKEQVDDQQLHIARYFERKNLAYCIKTKEELRNTLNHKKIQNNKIQIMLNKKLIHNLITFTEK